MLFGRVRPQQSPPSLLRSRLLLNLKGYFQVLGLEESLKHSMCLWLSWALVSSDEEQRRINISTLSLFTAFSG